MKVSITFISLLALTLNLGAQLTEQVMKDEEGTIISRYHVDESGTMQGAQEIYYENGNRKQIQYWGNGYLRDSILTYSNRGEIIGFGYIINEHLLYYNTDSLLIYEISLIKGGQYHGFFRLYNKEGYLEKVSYYMEGEEDDDVIFELNGHGFPRRLLSSFPHKVLNNKAKDYSYEVYTPTKEGIRYTYDENGLHRMDFLLDGAAHGVSYFFKNGEVENVVLYAKGVILSTEEKYGLDRFRKQLEHPDFYKVIGVKSVLKRSRSHLQYQSGF